MFAVQWRVAVPCRRHKGTPPEKKGSLTRFTVYSGSGTARFNQ